MKKVLAFALVLVLVVALAAPACAISDKDDVYTLTFYHIFADEASGGHESLWINKAIAEVEEKSGGRLKIDCVPAGVMGSEEELIPQVFAGTVDMSLSGPSVWGTVGSIDAIGWSELPYVVDNYPQMNALGEVLADLTNKQLEEAGIGLYCLGAMSQGIRCLCTAEKFPVKTVDDCKGLRIRVPQSEVYMSTVEGWGCAPTAMSSSQVITGLANGTIEGFESDPASILARGQQEGFHWYTETYHIASLNLLLDDIKAAGVEVITPTPEAFEGFKSADATYRDAKIAEWGDEAIFAEALDYVANNTK